MCKAERWGEITVSEQGLDGMFKLEQNMNNILTGSYLFQNGLTEWKFLIQVCNFASTAGYYKTIKWVTECVDLINKYRYA